VDHSCRTFEITAAATQQPKTKKNKKQKPKQNYIIKFAIPP
jgi:hypothetical protein